MIRKLLTAAGVAAALVAVSACEASKSSTPLSHSVDGPILGVTFYAPKMLEPLSDFKIEVDNNPATTLIQEASRPTAPVYFDVQLPRLPTTVFTRDIIRPGDSSRTSLRLPDPLATGRTYFWRAKAVDGANEGPYANALAFEVFTPIVIDVPVLLAPASNSTIDSLHPKFIVGNAPRSGPVGAITYLIELADSDAFSNKLATWTTAEQPNQTVLDPPNDLVYNKVYYWHVRAYDPTTLGPFSRTLAFTTPPVPVVVAPPPPPPTGGPAPNDAIDLRQARVYNSPPDVASWPATARISRIDMGSSGLTFQFSTQNSWPDVVPPGFSGPLQYTVWAVVNINGQWNTSGFIQMWRGRAGTGAPILANFATNWAYDARWGPMAGYQPHVGEQMGFFLTAGNARGEVSVSSIRERSNVVIVSLPAGDSGSFPF
jgi:hypothetical protein